MDAADRFAEQRGHGEHGHFRQVLLRRDGDRVREHYLVDRRLLDLRDGVAGKDRVRSRDVDGRRAPLDDDLCRSDECASGQDLVEIGRAHV